MLLEREGAHLGVGVLLLSKDAAWSGRSSLGFHRSGQLPPFGIRWDVCCTISCVPWQYCTLKLELFMDICELDIISRRSNQCAL